MFQIGWFNRKNKLLAFLSLMLIMSSNIVLLGNSKKDYFNDLSINLPEALNDSVKKPLIQKKDFGFSGNASLFSSFSTSNVPNVTTSPFNYGAALSTTFRFKKFTLPFTLRYNQNKLNVSYPFFRLSLSPSYKWAKLYVGDQTLSYNKLVFSGVNIFGLGFEIHPGWFYLSVIDGMVKQKIFIDSTSSNYTKLSPRFATKAFAVKSGIKSQSFNLLFTYLDSKDIKNSLSYYNPKFKLSPRSNRAIGVELMIRLSKNIMISSIDGVSIYTRDIDAGNLDTLLKSSHREPLPAWAKSIEKNPNTTSQIFYATENLVRYQNNTFGLGLKQRIIMPEYKTLALREEGNDVEQYTVESNFNFGKGKVTSNMSVGIQKNNLLSKLSQNTNSTIYDFSLNVTPNKKLFVNANFSNYGIRTSSTYLAPEDSISIRNINSNFGLTAMYLLNQDRICTKAINFNLNFLNSTEKYDGSKFENTNFNSLYFNGGYSTNNSEGLSYNGSLYYNLSSSLIPQISNEVQIIQSYGVSGGCGITLKKGEDSKNEVSGGVNLNLNYTGLATGEKRPGVGLAINLQYFLTKKLSLSSGCILSRTTIQNVNINQLNFNINLNTTF